MRMTPNRRRFLQALGLGAGGLFLPSLAPFGSRARAGGVASPMRLVILFTEHGTVHTNWDMHGGRDPDGQWEYDHTAMAETEFSEALRPLWRHRNKLTSSTACRSPPRSAILRRQPRQGWCSARRRLARETFGTSRQRHHQSLDRVVAQAARLGSASPTSPRPGSASTSTTSAALTARRPAAGGSGCLRESPMAVYNRLFPNSDGTARPTQCGRAGRRDGVSRRHGENLAPRLGTRTGGPSSCDAIRDERRIRLLDGLDCARPPRSRHYRGEVPHAQRKRAHPRLLDLATLAMSRHLAGGHDAVGPVASR
jgi:hypothetical protein